ncbi:peptide chain release factor N(5)-glutamine methyltransferase [Desulfogranum marinum]|jgi:release factor glutamine methyltransferase|uniref:peptide chain release factor N(5)-glutamine methyltransferase n=1 Tax=Desulfogranum marinum TaxID=453220 RepID=UPI0029C791C3|nr:peptide chain release factor N(5)-glutamine methyltransferase [Desulfogranum marinum]
MKITSLLDEATHRLQKAGIEEYTLDARLLLQFVTHWSRSELFLACDKTIEPATCDEFLSLIDQRCQRIPLHYITGVREFWSLDFHVSPSVLVPRSETEFLLDHVLARLEIRPGPFRAMDMCTGSGVIAVVLALELGCTVTAIDISPLALTVAAQNIARHNCEHLVQLAASDFFSALQHSARFDLIVCNPPYIPDNDIPALQPEVSQFEPMLALAGGSTGLDCIKQVIYQAKKHLTHGGCIFFEIGADQGQHVIELFRAAGDYKEIAIVPDWSGRDRIAKACFCG